MVFVEAIACSSFKIETIDSFSSRLSETDIFDISERYDSLIEKETAKKQGAFYTPKALVSSMVHEVLELFDMPPLAIADPACGSGIFLLECLKQLNSRYDLSNLLALNSIYGIDRDHKALSVAQLLLGAYAKQKGVPSDDGHQIISANLRHGNSLIAPEEIAGVNTAANLEFIDSFSWKDSYSKVFTKSQGFDLILGNPPYGLSRSQRISPVETELLRKNYLGNHRGRINTYILFILRSYALLAPKGVLTFVVPNAWLGIDEALTIRKLLIESCALTRINTFKVSPFKKLGVEVITFIIKKDSLATSLEIRTIDSMNETTPIKTELIPFLTIAKDPSYRISLTTNLKRSSLIEQIEASGTALKNESAQFKASIGLQAYGMGRGTPAQTAEVVATHPFHSDQKHSDLHIPYLEGKDVSPFIIRWGGQFIHYGPWLAECPPQSRYQDARLVVREILGQSPRLFQAAVTNDPFVYNRSILQIHPLSDQGKGQLRSLAAILNSSLAGFWLRQRGRKAQRKLFPKIVVHDLNDFPIPELSSSAVATLNALYDQIANLEISGETAHMSSKLRSLDQEVAKLYHVSHKDIEIEICN
jgi:hypothetical protein